MAQGVKAAKEMLSAIIQRGNLKRGDRQAFEDMWDGIHRFGKLSQKQMAWVERVYFDQKLDDPTPKKSKKKIGYIEDPKFLKSIQIETVEEFEGLAAKIIEKGSPTWNNAVNFLKLGNMVVLRPGRAK